jgi:hypothetical protein
LRARRIRSYRAAVYIQVGRSNDAAVKVTHPGDAECRSEGTGS